MLWEDNYLAHYGILGQKWGIRRFQNLDGSFTSEGKKRYKSSFTEGQFEKAKLKIKKFSTLEKPLKFKKEPIDYDKIKERGNLTSSEARTCAKLANYIFEKSSHLEPKITRDVMASIQDSGSTMYGLDKRLKQPTSLASKIGAEAKEKNITFTQASDSIKDAIRYTSILDDTNFVNQYESIKNSLLAKGYTESRCRNYFSLYKEGKVKHKSVQCIYADHDGNLFELQFQTVSSQAIKNLKIPLYEEARSTTVSAKRKTEIEHIMADMAEQIYDPVNIDSIKTHG